MEYFFILGNHPELSKSEIQSVLEKQKISYSQTASEATFLILEIEHDLNGIEFINQLGGTIKLGKVIEQIGQPTPQALVKEIEIDDKKINFGISVYNNNLDPNKLGIQIKRLLKEDGHKARFVTGKEQPLSSVIVKKNILNKQGTELVLLKHKNHFYLGQTLAVQPFELYSQLDYGRPARDDRSGMIPPKLAQIMINLSQIGKDEALLDPFCGSGTVLQQALLSDYQKVTGTDASKKAISDSKENLDWLADQIEQTVTATIKQENVVTLDRVIKPESIQAVVTEPYLGPPLRGGESPEKMQSIVEDLTNLYAKTFNSLKKVLVKNGTIVIIIPMFQMLKNQYPIHLGNILPKGLVLENQWQYSRPGQQVIRNIYKIVKK